MLPALDDRLKAEKEIRLEVGMINGGFFIYGLLVNAFCLLVLIWRLGADKKRLERRLEIQQHLIDHP